MNTNPFDRVNLGYDGLFGPRTMFYHLKPATSAKSLVQELDVPVLDIEGANVGLVESGTITIVLLGFLWVCWILARVVLRDFGIGNGGRRKKLD